MPSGSRIEDAAIIFSIEETVPSYLYEPALVEFARAEIAVSKELRERGFYASVVWYVLPAIAILLAKPFFEGIAKKAGEDTYAHFKPTIVKLLMAVCRTKGRVIGKPAGPLADELSLLIAFYAKLDSGVSVKFLIENHATEETYQEAVDRMCALLEVHFLSADGTDPLSLMTQQTKLISRTLLLRFRKDTGAWVAVQFAPEL